MTHIFDFNYIYSDILNTVIVNSYRVYIWNGTKTGSFKFTCVP